jgi:hypothetical protein
MTSGHGLTLKKHTSVEEGSQDSLTISNNLMTKQIYLSTHNSYSCIYLVAHNNNTESLLLLEMTKLSNPELSKKPVILHKKIKIEDFMQSQRKMRKSK